MEAANYGILSLIPLALTLLLAFWKKDAVFALLPASAEHPAQHSRAAADHQCSKKVITNILKTVIDYQSQSCQHTKIQTPGQKSP